MLAPRSLLEKGFASSFFCCSSGMISASYSMPVSRYLHKHNLDGRNFYKVETSAKVSLQALCSRHMHPTGPPLAPAMRFSERMCALCVCAQAAPLAGVR
jgi:hypothetical protein